MTQPVVGAPAQDHDVLAVLRITPFRRLWAALALSSLGDWLGLLATTGLAADVVLSRGGSSAQASFAMSGVLILRLAPAIVLGPLAGALADRLDRRLTMVVGDVLRFLLFASIPLVGSLSWLFVATLLVECVALFWGPAKDASVPNLVPAHRLEAANQLSLVTTYGSAPVAAALFAGLSLLSGIVDNVVPSLEASSGELALYVNALTFLVAAVVTARLDIPSAARGTEHPSLWRQITDGWQYVADSPLLRGISTGMLGAFAAGGCVIGLARPFVNALGGGNPSYGVLFGAVFVGLAAGIWGGPRLLAAFSRRRLFALALGLAGIMLVWLGLIPEIVMATISTAALGAFAGVAYVSGYTLIGLNVADEVRGRTFAFINASSRVVLVLVMAAAPALSALLGTRTVQITEHLHSRYAGPQILFALSGVFLAGVGFLTYRQVDDLAGVSLRHDLVRAWRVRATPTGMVTGARRVEQGFFIAVEGGDGAGKSTQIRMLAPWLRDRGHRVVLTHEPGATAVGRRLRDLLLHTESMTPQAEALLFAADRAHHVATVVRPALAEGSVVVTDRYVDSSVAYQGAGRALDPTQVRALSDWATGGLQPDLTVLLDVSPQVGRSRRGGHRDKLEAEPDDFHDRVRRHFLDLATAASERYLVLDGEQDHEAVQERLRERLAAVLPTGATVTADVPSPDRSPRR